MESPQDYLSRVGAPALFESLVCVLLQQRPDAAAVRECLRTALEAPPGTPVGAEQARQAILDFAKSLDKSGDGICVKELQGAQMQRLQSPRDDPVQLSETVIGTIEEFGMQPRQGPVGAARSDFAPGPDDALLVIDVQNDFCPGGSLATEDGCAIIPTVNAIIESFKADRIFYAQDWHPPDHWSFASQHKGCKPHDLVRWKWKGKDIEQVLWPEHCVMNTRGAEFREELTLVSGATVVRKGHQKSVDSYSIFYGADHETSTGLRPVLRARGIKRCFVVGIAYDFCVKFSALDAVECGHPCTVIRDACASVALPGTVDAANKHLQEKGVLLDMVTRRDIWEAIPASSSLDAFSLISHADLDGDQRVSIEEFMLLAECFFQSRHKGSCKKKLWDDVTDHDIDLFRGKWGVSS